MSPLPSDHEDRMRRTRLSLSGLSVGDAFGETFLHCWDEVAERRLRDRMLPPAVWTWTDDTAMALSIVEILSRYGEIRQGELADLFARRYLETPRRGYGAGTHRLLKAIAGGTPWSEAASAAFGGLGSYGNGGAMRAAPIGAYFSDDPDRAAEEGRKSGVVTHAHPEGAAGAEAVALSAALASQGRAGEILKVVGERLSGIETRNGILKAAELPEDCSVESAASLLGSGKHISSPDTVPFCLWAAQRFHGDYEEALWNTARGLGDVDTTCAIVGGIVALSSGGVPAGWERRREPLPPTGPG